MFISPGAEVYKGQIVGIHQRPGDLSLNVCKKKAATNVRSNKEQTGQKHMQFLPSIALKNENWLPLFHHQVLHLIFTGKFKSCMFSDNEM